MCRILEVHPSGFYAWIHKPLSDRAIEDERLLELIRESYAASGRIYGSPRIFLDLREAGEFVGRKRVARIMRSHEIRAIRGYRLPRNVVSMSSVLAPNRLQRQFTVPWPDHAWVTDITAIRRWEGWLYLAAIMDLHSRMIIGWSMQPTLHRDLVLDALLMAVWRRKPKQPVIVHSDQGCQYGSDDWFRFCKAHKLDPSMSRRGNCWDSEKIAGCHRQAA
jgi:putative transposase